MNRNEGPVFLPMAQRIRGFLPGVQWVPLTGLRVGILTRFSHPAFPVAANDAAF